MKRKKWKDKAPINEKEATRSSLSNTLFPKWEMKATKVMAMGNSSSRRGMNLSFRNVN